MNAIIALCHFCEQHGPSVIMCTQPYKQIQKSSNINQFGDTQYNLNKISRSPSNVAKRNLSCMSISSENVNSSTGIIIFFNL